MPANCGGTWMTVPASRQQMVGWQAAAGVTSPTIALSISIGHSRCTPLCPLQGATPGDAAPPPPRSLTQRLWVRLRLFCFEVCQNTPSVAASQIPLETARLCPNLSCHFESSFLCSLHNHDRFQEGLLARRQGLEADYSRGPGASRSRPEGFGRLGGDKTARKHSRSGCL